MSNYETACRIAKLEKDIPILESQLVVLQNRRSELQAMKAKNEPLQKKLLAKNRIAINRTVDTISLLKMELFGLQEQSLPRM